MLEKIDELLKSTNDAEIAFEALRDKNEDEIKALIRSSQSYQELQKACVGDYKCFISILSGVNIVICYRLHNTFEKQSIYITKNGVDSTRNDRAWMNTEVSNRLNDLGTKFYEEFYLGMDS